MYRALKIFVYSLTHTLGLCKFLHNTKGKTEIEGWKSECPVVDRLILELYPLRILK